MRSARSLGQQVSRRRRDRRSAFGRSRRRRSREQRRGTSRKPGYRTPASAAVSRLPDGHRQLIRGLVAPRNLFNLQVARRRIKNCTAEQKTERHLAFFQRTEILGRRDVEIKAARDQQLDRRLVAESRNVCVDLRPQHRTQRLAPPGTRERNDTRSRTTKGPPSRPPRSATCRKFTRAA